MRPDDETLAAAADDAEQRTQDARPAPKPRPAEGQNKLLPGQHKILRRLFREVARRVHPDLATDPESIELRNRLMHEAREAYQRGDVETLAQMYETYSDGDSTGKPTTDHTYVRRALEQMRLRLVAVEEAIDELKDGFLYHLMQRTHDAALDDRELLVEMAEHLDAQIDAAKREFDALSETDSDF
ncbi:MAG: hypothetical protein KDC46_16525 [Thermoleophilia bacterium]|nr:hypothetical protein [Thermoleophilia bacterium]